MSTFSSSNSSIRKPIFKKKRVPVKCPLGVLWKISIEWFQANFNSERLPASTHLLPGVSYFLRIFPNGYKEDERENVWIGFCVENDDDKAYMTAELNLSILSADYLLKTPVFQVGNKKISPFKLGTIAEMTDPKKHYFDEQGFMTLKLEGALTVYREVKFICEIEKEERDSLTKRSWKRDEQKNAIIKVQGQELKIHDFILKNMSPLLDECVTQNNSIVLITDFTYDIVEAVVRYHYDFTDVLSSLNIDTLCGILEFAEAYGVDLMKGDVEAYILETLKISPINVCKLANCSLKARSQKLENRCYEYLRDAVKKFPICDVDALNQQFRDRLITDLFFYTLTSKSVY